MGIRTLEMTESVNSALDLFLIAKETAEWLVQVTYWRFDPSCPDLLPVESLDNKGIPHTKNEILLTSLRPLCAAGGSFYLMLQQCNR